MSLSPSIQDQVTALQAQQQEHTNLIAQMQPTLESASGTVNDLARQIQLNAATPQPTSGASSVTNNNTTKITGLSPTFIAPVSLFAGTSSVSVTWTTCPLPATVPTTAKNIILEYLLTAAQNTSSQLYARVNSIVSQQRLIVDARLKGVDSGIGSQIGVMPFDTTNMAIDLEMVTDAAGGFNITYAVSVCGYWA